MEGEGQSGSLEEQGQQQLNYLQNYLVNFSKEIEVTGNEGAAFQHNVSQIITQTSQPVFVTVPVSTETTTPDEEQLPVISAIKSQKQAGPEGIIDSDIVTGDTLEEDGYEHMDDSEDVQTSQIVTVDNQVEGLPQGGVSVPEGAVRLQELTLEQVTLQSHPAFSVSEGMVMLPMGDAANILSQTDPRLVQIVNVNGQPTLQVVNDTATVIRQSDGSTAAVHLNHSLAQPPSVTPQTSTVQSIIDGTDPVAVLASVAANTTNVNQMQTIQLSQQDMNAAQLVALRNTADGSQPQLVAVQMDDTTPASVTGNNAGLMVSAVDGGLHMPNPIVMNTVTGYQSVAIVPSGEQGEHGEVNYVLIVNQNADKDNMQGPVYDFGDDIQGEVIEELTDENGTTKRLVKINQLLAKRSLDAISAIPVGDQLMCSYCSYTSPKRYLLSRHMKSHSEDRPHKCGLCERGFKTMASLQNHVNTHTGTRPHKCKLCDSAFTTSGELVRHIRYKHTFEKPHKCTECDYASVELSKLKRHIRSHTGERPYACNHCNYASPDTYKLKRHMRIHTGEKPYQCETCHAKFTQSNSLKAHKLIHSGNKPVFQCTMCPATCGRKTDLKIHMQKLHTSDHPLMCKKCGQSFPDRYTLKMHAKSHEGEKSFSCAECDYAAISQRHLETHMLTHTGIKPYECVDCDLAFRQKQLLKRHRNLYHNLNYTPPDPKDKEHECKACEKRFAHRGNLERHVQHSHISDGSSSNSNASTKEDGDKSPGFHTCGGCPRSVVDGVTPLTADQLIENSLLADMKEGKLGTSPKVVVVHPDGRVEEVTAKLQSLSQSKPVDDFLVSLGVTGDSHFDQVTEVAGLPSDVCVSTIANNTVSVVTSDEAVNTSSIIGSSQVINITGLPSTIKENHIITMPDGLILDHTKEEGTQASFDSDEDESKKMKILGQEQLLRLAQGDNTSESLDSQNDCGFKISQVDGNIDHSIQQIMVSVLQAENHESRMEKRALDTDGQQQQPVKKYKIVLADPAVDL